MNRGIAYCEGPRDEGERIECFDCVRLVNPDDDIVPIVMISELPTRVSGHCPIKRRADG
jgi:hypothetical protein